MFLTYLIIRLITFPMRFLNYKMIHKLGKSLGTIAYHLIPKFRKRALSNLALSSLDLSNEEIRQIAKKSIQSVMITCLEYPKLAREKNLARIVRCTNPKEADQLKTEGKGIVFFCGHQSNWELLFLEGTSRMPGVAIGRPIKNRYLYEFVLRMREQYGGRIITPKKAIKEGLKTLREGKFFGIIGDQGMPDSGFSCPFLGRMAYTSPAPAMLAYKTNCPIIVATTKRLNDFYEIHYSPPLFPDCSRPMAEEVERLMKQALALLEETIRDRPEEWLWIHNRWKQQPLGPLRKKYRQDSIAIVIPEDESLLKDLHIIRTLYPTEEITLYLPKLFEDKVELPLEKICYTKLDELLIEDLRFKTLFNFTKDKTIDRHFKKGSVQTIYHPSSFQELSREVQHA